VAQLLVLGEADQAVQHAEVGAGHQLDDATRIVCPRQIPKVWRSLAEKQ
jgi:hypothetical protein